MDSSTAIVQLSVLGDGTPRVGHIWDHAISYIPSISNAAASVIARGNATLFTCRVHNIRILLEPPNNGRARYQRMAEDDDTLKACPSPVCMETEYLSVNRNSLID